MKVASLNLNIPTGWNFSHGFAVCLNCCNVIVIIIICNAHVENFLRKPENENYGTFAFSSLEIFPTAMHKFKNEIFVKRIS